MIYEFPDESKPIRQGDIFYPIPNTVIDLDSIPVLGEDPFSAEVKNWDEIAEKTNTAALPIKSSWAIVASQDCDTVRSPVISFFVITSQTDTSGNPDEFKNYSPKKWVNWITKRSKEDSKWFYLPPDEKIGFLERKVAIFQNIIQIPRESLEKRKYLRKGRLCHEADEHFRESIAQFFRRYPYNEWYPLDKDEYTEYNNEKGPTDPYPWQS